MYVPPCCSRSNLEIEQAEGGYERQAMKRFTSSRSQHFNPAYFGEALSMTSAVCRKKRNFEYVNRFTKDLTKYKVLVIVVLALLSSFPSRSGLRLVSNPGLTLETGLKYITTVVFAQNDLDRVTRLSCLIKKAL